MRKEHKRQLAIFGCVAALFFTGGCALVYLGARSYLETRAFVASASAAEGKVTGFKAVEIGTGFDERENARYAIVEYAPANGERIRFQGPSSQGLIRLKRGETVRVLYPPDNPEAARVDTFMGLWFTATILGGVGMGAIIIPLLTLWQAWKWAERQDPDGHN
jgi:hypothetical protein